VKVDSASFGVTTVNVKITNAYDGSSVTGATTVVNGETCEETQPGVYTIKLATWSPIQRVTVQTDAADFETWETSTIHVMNIILYLAIIVAVTVIAILFLKLRNRNRT